MQTAGLEAPKNSPQVPRSAFAQSKWFIEGGPGYGPQRNSLCSTYTFAGIQSSPRQNCNWSTKARILIEPVIPQSVGSTTEVITGMRPLYRAPGVNFRVLTH